MGQKVGGDSFRARLETIIFEADTPPGKLFDLALLWTIVLSIVLVTLESVPSIRAAYGPTLRGLEWFFTGLFTLEYLARLYSAKRPLRYAVSFYGVVDLLAIIPSYLSLFSRARSICWRFVPFGFCASFASSNSHVIWARRAC